MRFELRKILRKCQYCKCPLLFQTTFYIVFFSFSSKYTLYGYNFFTVKTVEEKEEIHLLQEMVVSNAIALVEGRYFDVVQHPECCKLIDSIVQSIPSTKNLEEVSKQVVKSFIDQNLDDDFVQSFREVLVVQYGAAYLNLFVQANFTGPELPEDEDHLISFLQAIFCTFSTAGASNSQKMEAIALLECDGIPVFPSMSLPQYLLAAKCLLTPLAEIQHVIDSIDENGGNSMNFPPTHSSTGLWWLARCLYVLQQCTLEECEHCPTLKLNIKRCFGTARNSILQMKKLNEDGRLLDDVDGCDNTEPKIDWSSLAAQCLLEWGLVQNFYCDVDGAKASFRAAQSSVQLKVELSGALGIRTKFQTFQTAQLRLEAESGQQTKLEEKQETEDALHDEVKGKTDANCGSEGDNADLKSLVPEVKLEEDNILLEQIKFEDEENSKKGQLSLLDQCILIALCLDVKNNNPSDGLTIEQMHAYVAKILETPANWMVHSSGYYCNYYCYITYLQECCVPFIVYFDFFFLEKKNCLFLVA